MGNEEKKQPFCLLDFSQIGTDQHNSCFLVTFCEPENLGSMIGALRSMLMKPGYHWHLNNEVGPSAPRLGFEVVNIVLSKHLV